MYNSHDDKVVFTDTTTIYKREKEKNNLQVVSFVRSFERSVVDGYYWPQTHENPLQTTASYDTQVEENVVGRDDGWENNLYMITMFKS